MNGAASATVRMRRPGVAVLSASYDPGWTATVNGLGDRSGWWRQALVAVNVPAGTDHVVFRFHGYGDYPELLALSGLTLAMVAVAPVCIRRVRWRPVPGHRCSRPCCPASGANPVSAKCR